MFTLRLDQKELLAQRGSLIDYRHMIKYRYIPFDLGKKARYGGKK